MVNFAPQMKQQGYSNQFREDYEFTVKQEGVSNADLLGQAFQGLADVSETGYRIAQKQEAEEKEYQREAKAKADEAKKERTVQAYNEFARQKMAINARAEQTGNWNQADLETRRLLDLTSRKEGVEYGKLLELSGKTDFTGYYGIEKNARQKYDTARIEQELKAWDAIVAANPEAGAAFTPKEGISYMNQVNNSWDAGMKDVAELKNIDKNADPHEYARVERNLINNLKDNIAATSILSIMRGTKGLQTDTEIQQFISKEQQRLVKAGVAPERAAIITQVGMQRSGILGVVKAINNEQTLYQEDVKRLMATRETDGYVLMGATETPYAAMWVKTDDFKSGQYLQTEHRLADKYMRELIPALAESRGANFTPIISPEIRGNIYSMGSKIIKGNIGTPVLKGKVLGHMLSDATNFYGNQDAETRQQAYEAILKEYDNPYTDAVIKALQSDADPFKRDMGNELAKQMQFLRDSKSISVFETSMTPAANSYRLLKQGPGADLLRVTKDGELVMVDGSKGFLQSTAITLSDMTGRYFGAAADLNKYFGEIYKDAETRKQMLKAGGIPELDPMTEEIIGRKEWYFSSKKSPEEVEIEKQIAALDEAWKGKVKTGEYWKQRRAIEAEQLGEPYNLADLPGDIVKGIGKGIITGAKGIGVGINRMLGNKTVWDKPEQELKGTGAASMTISTGFPRMVPANTESVTEGVEASRKAIPGYTGNIDIINRPEIQNEDGTFSTIESMSFYDDTIDKEVLIPTIKVIDGVPERMSKDEAISWYYATGEHLGIFDKDKTKEADAMGEKISNFKGQEQAFEKTATNKADRIIEESELDLYIMSDIVGIIESNNRSDAVSNKGATGIMQLMPETYKDIAKRYGLPLDGIKDPNINKKAGEIYLAELGNKFNNDDAKVLAAYNWGPTNLSKAIKKHGKNWRRYLPEETKNYLIKYYDILSKGVW